MGQGYLGYVYSDDLASTTYKPFLAPLWDDLEDDSTAGNEIGYVTLGTSPNRTFVVQWKNVKWNYNGTAGQNFQVRLYETTNVIQFVYGAMVTPNSLSASIGISDATGGSTHFISVTPASPPTYSTTTANNGISAITYLTSGTTYTFTPPATCPVNWPGPDGFGYVGQTATYSWVDISTTGTQVSMSGDDVVSSALDLGLWFQLYGTGYTQFYVSTNGLISFGSGQSAYFNYNLPSASAPNNIIAPVWDDLNVDSDARIWYQLLSPCPLSNERTCTVIEFYNMDTLGGATAGTWEVILFPAGNVIMQFQSMGTANGARSTTGIQGSVSTNSTYGLGYAYNCTGRPAAATAIKFVYPCSLIWNQPVSTVDTNA